MMSFSEPNRTQMGELMPQQPQGQDLPVPWLCHVTLEEGGVVWRDAEGETTMTSDLRPLGTWQIRFHA